MHDKHSAGGLEVIGIVYQVFRNTDDHFNLGMVDQPDDGLLGFNILEILHIGGGYNTVKWRL